MKHLLLTLAMVLVTALPVAAADDTTTTSTIPTAGMEGVFDRLSVRLSEGRDFQAEYASLSVALIDSYAQASNQAISEFMAANSAEMDVLVGTNIPASTFSTVNTPAQLEAVLVGAGATFAPRPIASRADFVGMFTAAAASYDTTMALGLASDALSLGGVAVPTELPNSALADQMPSDALVFGLFANQLQVELLKIDPARAVGGSKLFSQTEFAEASRNAAARTASLVDNLPMGCVAEMLTVMATGSTGGSRTSAALAGQYLYEASRTLLAPGRLGADPLTWDGPSISSDDSNSLFEVVPGAAPPLTEELRTVAGADRLGDCEGATTGLTNLVGRLVPELAGTTATRVDIDGVPFNPASSLPVPFEWRDR